MDLGGLRSMWREGRPGGGRAGRRGNAERAETMEAAAVLTATRGAAQASLLGENWGGETVAQELWGVADHSGLPVHQGVWRSGVMLSPQRAKTAVSHA